MMAAYHRVTCADTASHFPFCFAQHARAGNRFCFWSAVQRAPGRRLARHLRPQRIRSKTMTNDIDELTALNLDFVASAQNSDLRRVTCLTLDGGGLRLRHPTAETSPGFIAGREGRSSSWPSKSLGHRRRLVKRTACRDCGVLAVFATAARLSNDLRSCPGRRMLRTFPPPKNPHRFGPPRRILSPFAAASRIALTIRPFPPIDLAPRNSHPADIARAWLTQ